MDFRGLGFGEMTPTERRVNPEMEDWRRRVDADIAVLKQNVSAIQAWEQEDRRLHQRVTSFMDTFNATQAQIKADQETRHQENQQKLESLNSRIGLGQLAIAVLGLLLTFATAIIAYQAGKNHAKLDPTHLFSNDPSIAER